MTDRPVASFDTLADAYARYRLGYADEIYEILARAGIGTGTRVLDLACGTGIVSAALAARGAHVTGIDPSAPMLERAAAALPGVRFTVGKAEALPFERASFDAVVCAQAFHWFDRERALSECARVVRPGGLVAVWWKSLTRGDTVKLLRDEISRGVGLEPVPDILAAGFEAFDRAPLTGQELHVVPWNVERTTEEIIGYERSRARSLTAYGSRLDEYLTKLEERLGAPSERYTLSYVHYLYLARVPETG